MVFSIDSKKLGRLRVVKVHRLTKGMKITE